MLRARFGAPLLVHAFRCVPKPAPPARFDALPNVIAPHRTVARPYSFPQMMFLALCQVLRCLRAPMRFQTRTTLALRRPPRVRPPRPSQQHMFICSYVNIITTELSVKQRFQVVIKRDET